MCTVHVSVIINIGRILLEVHTQLGLNEGIMEQVMVQVLKHPKCYVYCVDIDDDRRNQKLFIPQYFRYKLCLYWVFLFFCQLR